MAILIAILSLVGGTSVFVQRFQVQRLGRKEIENAELALGRGEYPTAEQLFRDYLQVFPDDVEVSIEYAGTLLKGSKTSDRKKKARRIYDDILRDNLNRDDVRRSLMKLKIEEKQFVSAPEQANGADVDVDALLKRSPDDGELHFLEGNTTENFTFSEGNAMRQNGMPPRRAATKRSPPKRSLMPCWHTRTRLSSTRLRRSPQASVLQCFFAISSTSPKRPMQ